MHEWERETHLSASVNTAGSDSARCGIERVLEWPSLALFAPDNDELGSKEFDPVSGVRCDHKRGLSGGRYEIEDWRREGGRLRDVDTAQLFKWWDTGSDGEDVGEVSKPVVGGAVGERASGTHLVKFR